MSGWSPHPGRSAADPPPPGEGERKKTAKIHDQQSGPERLLFSEKFACPVSGFTIPEIEPRLFSFNSPHGACPAGGGLGVEQKIDAELVVPDKEASLRRGAVAPWSRSSSPYYLQTLEALARAYKFSVDTPWSELPEKARHVVLYGTGEDDVTFSYDDGLRSYRTTKSFEGVIPNLERRWKETDSNWMREEIERYHSAKPCDTCHGKRLKPEALAVKLDKLDIAADAVAPEGAMTIAVEDFAIYLPMGDLVDLDAERTRLAREIEAARRAMTRYVKRGGQVWIRVFPDVPVSKKPLEVRMGSGKGNVEYYVARVQPGKVLFEMEGVTEEIAREAFRLAASKLSVETMFVKRQVR